MRLQNLFISLLFAEGIAAAPADACYPDESNLSSGFKAEYISSVPLANQLDTPNVAQLRDYVISLRNEEAIATVENYEKASFNLTTQEYPDGFNLPGQPSGNYHFAMRLSGYLRAPFTGNYSFYVYTSDGDAALLQIGKGIASSCCKDAKDQPYDDNSPNQSVYVRKSFYGQELEIEMEAGLYYPVSLSYYNAAGDAFLNFALEKSPEGGSGIEIFHLNSYSEEQCDVPVFRTFTVTSTDSSISEATDVTVCPSETLNGANCTVNHIVPAPSTLTTTITQSRKDTTTVTYEASGSAPGSVVIEVPPAEVVTTTITVDRTDTTTVTFEASASQPGSVVIEVPTEQVTSTVWSNNTETVTTTRQSSGLTSVPVSVVDEASTSYVTVTSTISSIIATTTRYVSGHGAGPATVVICVPPAGRKTFTITKPCPVCTADHTSYEVPQGEGPVTKWIETATGEPTIKPAATKTAQHANTLPAQDAVTKTAQGAETLAAASVSTKQHTAASVSTKQHTAASAETSSAQPSVSVEPQVGSGSVFYAPSVASLVVLVISALM